jgi:hypothetical protein
MSTVLIPTVIPFAHPLTRRGRHDILDIPDISAIGHLALNI